MRYLDITKMKARSRINLQQKLPGTRRCRMVTLFDWFSEQQNTEILFCLITPIPEKIKAQLNSTVTVISRTSKQPYYRGLQFLENIVPAEARRKEALVKITRNSTLSLIMKT